MACKNIMENPARTQHISAKEEGHLRDDLRADKLWKVWGFRVGTWNDDSLTGREDEAIEALMDR